MIVFDSSQGAKAVSGWTITSTTCSTNDKNVASIPYQCENHDVVINAKATVYLDAVKVWQDDLTHYECQPTLLKNGVTYKYGYLSGSTCWYTYNIAASPKLFYDYYQLWNGVDRTCPSYSYRGTDYVFDGNTWLTGSGSLTTRVCEYALTQPDTIIKEPTPAAVVSNTKGSECGVSVNTKTGFIIEPDLAKNCDTKRHFTSLSISNEAKLTNSGLTLSDMVEDISSFGGTTNGALADNTIGVARWKKVDLLIDNALKINNNGGIDVDGTGYPHALTNYNDCANTGVSRSVFNDCNGGGWGPGGGRNLSSDRKDHIHGGSASYASQGGYAIFDGGVDTNSAASTYGDESVSSLEWGSAGGNGIGDGGNVGFGGNGGGRIQIITGELVMSGTSYISADGGNGLDGGQDDLGGGGSGGSIKILITNGSGSSSLFNADVQGFKHNFTNILGDDNPSGTVKSVAVNVGYNVSAPTISAVGGLKYRAAVGTDSGDWSQFYIASGGRIYLEKTGGAGTTVYKWLEPIKRNNEVNPSYNPYALQVGDIVKVNFNLGNYSGTIDLEDEYLHLPDNTKSCRLYKTVGDPYPNTGWVDSGSSIKWTGLPSATYTSGKKTIYYYCKVQ